MEGEIHTNVPASTTFVSGTDKRETLAERSQRVIGRPLEWTDPFKPLAKSEVQPTRRGQILQAQRTHRFRTQQYIRELEKEVCRLRDSEAAQRRKIQELQNLLTVRTNKSLQHHPPLPEALMQFEQTGDMASEEIPGRPVHVDLSKLATVQPEGPCTQHPGDIPEPVYHPHLSAGQEETSQLACFGAQEAVDFLLQLEEPCLPHLKHAHLFPDRGLPASDMNFNSGPGHLLTASSNLLFSHSQPRSEDYTFDVSEEEVERLLRTSMSLPLTHEMTPVQIWMKVKEQSLKHPVSTKKLEIIRSELQIYAYCNSFGAVVNEFVVEALLADMFP